ncbi:ribonuclease HI large subunit [Talaromyces proteolyticus]|uniref:Ribonuclease n=1 Tax=Talaromyces proteolyticus TaxID=1131652 RepID=A0AAD4L439_9EURO|nr:ribonuclease HI large subunit [Talaromyces proteolyticus]KAH8704274.1 ribonuclease HI large subunit [Talaromyces proteolyticus]
MEETSHDSRDPESSFIPATINHSPLLNGESYSCYSPCPKLITPASVTASSLSEETESTPCVLGVDEAGRGPVLGPMVYSAFYLPKDSEKSLLTEEHSFDDSKVLTPEVRKNLMQAICSPDHPLHDTCGWAVKVLSAKDISAGMLRPGLGVYNLNAQAMDATIEIIRGVVEQKHISVKEVYIDTIGNPATYQQKLERIFPTLKITVAKKADSLYPCVSAASVVAKVTRDIALEVCYEAVLQARDPESAGSVEGWGSGYPSDSKCVGWLRRDMDSLFGWGNECRFSWGTAKEMIEGRDAAKVDWPSEENEEAGLSEFLLGPGPNTSSRKQNDLSSWYGSKIGVSF